MTARFVGVTGLPRAGSTLLCQLLAQHPEIHCEGHSSPLCNVLLGIRRMISDDTFFLAQLDTSFDTSYTNLAAAMQGFVRGWHHESVKKIVVDKNRAWLHAIELLLHIEPNAKLIVCLRDLAQIYGSIEAQHQRTILVDFIDHLAARCAGSAEEGAGTSVLPAIRGSDGSPSLVHVAPLRLARRFAVGHRS